MWILPTLFSWPLSTHWNGLRPRIGAGFPLDTISGDIPATNGAPSISSLDVLIFVSMHHAFVYQKMFSRLPHRVMIGDRSPVQDSLVHRGTKFRGGID